MRNMGHTATRLLTEAGTVTLQRDKKNMKRPPTVEGCRSLRCKSATAVVVQAHHANPIQFDGALSVLSVSLPPTLPARDLWESGDLDKGLTVGHSHPVEAGGASQEENSHSYQAPGHPVSVTMHLRHRLPRRAAEEVHRRQHGG